jgi:hypothetical protein
MYRGAVVLHFSPLVATLTVSLACFPVGLLLSAVVLASSDCEHQCESAPDGEETVYHPSVSLYCFSVSVHANQVVWQEDA